jgi:hypothetical protein
MNKNTKNCYDAFKKLSGDEVNHLLKEIPFENLISLITIGMNIFHKEFFSYYDVLKKDDLH